MNIKKQTVGLLLVLAMVLVACAPKATPAPAPISAPAPAEAPAPVPAAPTAPTRAAWEVEWEKVVAAAGKERVVTIIATRPQFRPAWGEAMKKYGVTAEVFIGRAGDTAAKLITEQRAGIYTWDVYTGGTTTPLIQVKPAGGFAPLEPALILPEVIDPKNWSQGKLPFLDKDKTYLCFFAGAQPVIAVNTNLVKPGEIASYNDILAPKWSGKVLLNDPTLPGTITIIVLGEKIMGWDWVRKLAATKPLITRDEHQQIDWLARGKVAIVIGPKDGEITAFKEVGAPIEVVIPKEGAYISAGAGGVGLVNKAAHPNAARLFINWLLTKEGQTASSRAVGAQSDRVDVPTDHLNPLVVRDPAKKYYMKDNEEFLLKQNAHMNTAKEVFTDLLK